MITFTPEQFEEVRAKGEEIYRNIKDVYCPYFKEKINFNSEGLEHLRFKGRNKVRTEKDQFMRFELLYLAPEVLKLSSTVQGVLETKKFEKVRIHNRTDILLKPVNYYEFIAVIKRNRVKVIVKQVDGEAKFFWSIIPFWHMNQETMTRIFHEGIPEED